MTPVELSRTVLHAVRRAVDGGELSVTVPERVVVGPPGPGGCGDYATNVALQLARPAGQPPLRVAGILQAHLLDLGSGHAFEDVVVTPPGFINFRLRDSAPVALVEEILRRGTRYGHSDESSSGRVLRLHSPREVRALVVMDVVARLLRSQGAQVSTTCDGAPDPRWVDILGVRGVRIDRHGGSRVPSGTIEAGEASGTGDIRPVPAPADPTHLGRDAARWALLHPAPHDRPRIGDEHLVQRESNPLFRVRYAHARTRALLRNAADLGFTPEPGPLSDSGGASRTAPAAASRRTPGAPGTPEPGPLSDADGVSRTAPAAVSRRTPGAFELGSAPGASLIPLLADHPRVLGAAATAHAPDRLARHLVDVADAVLPFLAAVLPVGEEKPSAAHRARLALAEAAGTVLAGGLSLLGIDAPDHL